MRSVDGSEKLQQDLDNLVLWSQKWQLGFNESKCKVIHMGTSNTRHQYTMSATSLESTPDEKDLDKILNGIDRVDSSLFFCMVTGSWTRGHNQKMVKSHTKIGIRQNVFSQRVVNDRNSIPAHVVDSPTLNTFKSHLTINLFHIGKVQKVPRNLCVQ